MLGSPQFQGSMSIQTSEKKQSLFEVKYFLDDSLAKSSPPHKRFQLYQRPEDA